MSKKPSKDRASLCTFTFSDGRQCKTPRQPGDSDFCYFHSKRELQRLAAKNAGDFVASAVATDYVSACALNGSLGRLFRAVACGQINPKTAHTLAYLAQVMAQTLPLAEEEFARTFGRQPLLDTLSSAFGKLNPKFIKSLEDSDSDDEEEDDDGDENSDDSTEPDEAEDLADPDQHDDSADPEVSDDSAESANPQEPADSTESEVRDKPNGFPQPDSPPPSTIQTVPSIPNPPNPDPPLPRIIFR